MMRAVRSGWVAANSAASEPPSEIPRIETCLGTDGVEDGKDVVHPLLERRRGRRAVPIRKPAATAVEEDQAGELRESPEERRERRLLPEHLDVGSQPVGPHQVDRSVPHDLVGDVHLARSGVPRLRLVHCRPRLLAAPHHSAPLLRPMPGPLNVRHTACRVATAACSGSLPTGPPGPDRTEESSWSTPRSTVSNWSMRSWGRARPMLLIHGAHIADALRPLVAEPALERFQRIRYHRRGLGGSTYPVDAGPTSVPVQAEDAVGLLDHLGVDRAHLVGHSLGGAIALELAAQHPTRVASLVLLEPAFLTMPAGAAFARAVAPLTERYQAGDAEGAVHGFLALVGDHNWRATIERTVPGGIAQAVKDAATFFEIELPGPTWTFGPAAGRSHHLPRPLRPRKPTAAPCSSRGANCSTSGSRPARTPTSSARPTCSRCRRQGRWRQRSPPSCDGAGCAPPDSRHQRRVSVLAIDRPFWRFYRPRD